MSKQLIADLALEVSARCREVIVDAMAHAETHQERADMTTLVLATIAGQAGASAALAVSDNPSEEDCDRCTLAVLDAVRHALMRKGAKKRRPRPFLA